MRDHDALRCHRLCIGKRDPKSAVHGLDLRRSDVVDVGDQVLDVPVRVVEELVERQRRPPLDALDFSDRL